MIFKEFLIVIALTLAFSILTKVLYPQNLFDQAFNQYSEYFDFELGYIDTIYVGSQKVDKLVYYDKNKIKRRVVNLYSLNNINSVLNFDVNGNGTTFWAFYPNGSKMQFSIKMGDISLNIDYYQDGRIMSYNESFNLKPVGYSAGYCSNGRLYSEAFIDSMNYSTTRYHCNGNIRESGIIIGHEKKDGEWKYWNSDGELERVEIYSEGKLIEANEYPAEKK